MSKCLLLNSKKKLAKIHVIVFEKNPKLLNSDAFQFQKVTLSYLRLRL